MSKVKTAQLRNGGAALDWAVAKAEKRLGKFSPENYFNVVLIGHQCFTRDNNGERVPYTPSEDWAQGGPIIEREKIDLIYRDGEWVAEIVGDECCIERRHRNPLVAAMRCFVASKLGEDVEVPDELVTL